MKMPYNNNPYNFIPLFEHVYTRYDSMEELPAHGVWERELLSGVITCTFTAETPVCVSNGEETKSNFFRQVDGSYVIPGSSIKGVIRTNMMILGLGALRPGEDLDDVRMLYRAMASAKGSVKELVKQDYQEVLGYKSGTPRVRACYVRREGKAFVIYPTEKPFLRVARRILPEENWAKYKALCEKAREDKKQGKNDKPVLLPYEYTKIKVANDLTVPNPICEEKWVDAWADTFPVWYRASGETVKQMETRTAGETREGWSPGVLMATGYMENQNTLYLFPDFDEAVEHFTWPEKDRLVYEMDYERRKNILKGTKKENEKAMDSKFWALPDSDKASPFFLLEDQTDGIVVGKTPYLRIAFQHTPGEGVPEAHRAAAMELTLDYPYAVLGFASNYLVEDEEGGEKKKNLAYRSRVSFGDFRARANAEPSLHKKVPGCGPKPTSFPDYLLPENREVKSYNDDQFSLRGIKQYWLKPPQEQAQDKRKKNTNIDTDLNLMGKGTQFTGKIRFRNLAEDELGLLLWCLTLDDGQEPKKTYFQTVGKGKPWGYGRMKVTLDAVEQLCPERLYSASGLASGEYTQPLDAQALIAAYCSHMSQELKARWGRKAPLREMSAIQDFLYMHSVERKPEEVHYPELEDYKNREQFMPTVREERKAAEKAAKEPAVEGPDEEYRRRKAELGEGDWMKAVKLIQDIQKRHKGWRPPQDTQ